MTAYTSQAWISLLTRIKVWVWPQNGSKLRQILARKCVEAGPHLPQQLTTSKTRTKTISIGCLPFCFRMRTLWSMWATNIRLNSSRRRTSPSPHTHTASKSRRKGMEPRAKPRSCPEILDRQLIHSLKIPCFSRVKHLWVNREIDSKMRTCSPRLEVQTRRFRINDSKGPQLTLMLAQETFLSTNNLSTTSNTRGICQQPSQIKWAWNSQRAQFSLSRRAQGQLLGR